jgi:hypothetical protein
MQRQLKSNRLKRMRMEYGPPGDDARVYYLHGPLMIRLYSTQTAAAAAATSNLF